MASGDPPVTPTLPTPRFARQMYSPPQILRHAQNDSLQMGRVHYDTDLWPSGQGEALLPLEQAVGGLLFFSSLARIVRG